MRGEPGNWGEQSQILPWVSNDIKRYLNRQSISDYGEVRDELAVVRVITADDKDELQSELDEHRQRFRLLVKTF
jgi:hypothetical protein